ncbi:helix-turn-helix transcriptional regulator [Antrihabitans cavernicola]|uniref:YafY family transcriptional regulator n=1 Tax=Antrihabitans cavernicola TaxID=2495913 RepID=A0A5A7S4Y6_9NOCA|nr:YafY family protein [Spelaeibacter cavernicola]KAA0017058.1 YafY family transcriptional regulator [Spelaeibacter cavernicola]
MRSSRLVEIMLRLQGSRSATAATLADELGVSVRTIYRDVSALSAAGVPLWTDTGPGGGIRLLDGWQSKLSGLTGTETSALMLLGIPSLAEDLGLGSEAARAESKLLGALPLPLRIGAEAWRRRLHVDAPGWFARPVEVGELPTIAQAVLGGWRVRFEYRRRPDSVERTVDPLGLVAKASVWYLVARVGGRVLSYRVDRIESAAVLDETFDRPDDFDLAAWWEQSNAEFDRSIRRYACTVRLSPSALRLLPQYIGVQAAQVATGEPDSAGWVTVDLMLEAEVVALGQLCALAGFSRTGEGAVGVEVMAPPELREALRALGAGIAGRNGA